MNLIIFGNSLRRFLFAILVFLILFFGIRFLLNRLNKYLNDGGLKGKKIFSFLESVTRLPLVFWILIELFVTSKILIIPDKTNHIINMVCLVVLIYGSARIIIKMTNYFVGKVLSGNASGQKTVEFLVKIIVWVIGILIFLTNIGVNLTPLVASLGVASIAVAFALQNILSDLFASFSILISKPFKIGDFISVGDIDGTVQGITLKSTILKNVKGQEVVIPNNTILTSKVVNSGKMKHRGERETIGVIYSTDIKLLKEIPDIIGGVIRGIEGVEFQRCYLKKLNDYSIDFLYAYQIESPVLLDSLKINEKIYLGILEEFEKKGIEIAFPSQTIYNTKN